MASPQKENGYTPIAHEILEQLVKTDLLGTEYRILFFILRKTYGYQKKQDIISLSQFQKGTGISRPTVVKTLKNLMSRNMIVKIYLPDEKIAFVFNKDYEKWVVNTSKLVKGKWLASKDVLTKSGKDVLTHNRKKKLYTIERESDEESSQDIVTVIDSFKEVNPSYSKWFGNKTQRAAAARLIKIHGVEKLKKIISFLPKSNTTDYMPVITSPLQLEDKFAQLATAWQKLKNKEPIIL